MILIQLILYSVLFLTLLRWGLEDKRKLSVKDSSMKQMLILFAITFIAYLYLTRLSDLGVITLIEGLVIEAIAGFILWIGKQQASIDYLALLLAFICFPFVSAFSFGICVLIQITNKKIHKEKYQRAFIWLYFISFVISSVILFPFLYYIKF